VRPWLPVCVVGRDPCSSRASLADAIRRHWLCLGSIHDARCLPVRRWQADSCNFANYSNANFDHLGVQPSPTPMTAIAIILSHELRPSLHRRMIIDRFGGGSTPARVRELLVKHEPYFPSRAGLQDSRPAAQVLQENRPSEEGRPTAKRHCFGQGSADNEANRQYYSVG